MQDYFLWNGVDCRTYGIHVTEQPPITIPAERSTQTNVPGRPGSLTQMEGEDVYDEEKRYFAGHSSGGKEEELYIPFLVWGSESFQKNHADVWKYILSKKDAPFRTDSFPAYVRELLSVQYVAPLAKT